MRIIAVGGEPACGKSRVFRSLIPLLDHSDSADFAYGLLKGTFHTKSNAFVLGIYGDGLFDGTDKLSMAVQRDAERFIDMLAEQDRYKSTRVFFEGDRLFNGSFLLACKDRTDECLFVILEASAAEKNRRHSERKDTQTERFKKGRSTKYKNLLQSGLPIEVMRNETPDDLEVILSKLISY